MANRGYLSWTKRMVTDSFRLDGFEYSENCFVTFRQSRKPTIPILEGADGTGLVQSHALGGDQPENLRARIFQVTVDTWDEDEYDRLLEAGERGPDLLSFMPGSWVVDRWRLDKANASPTTWRSSRGIWLGSPTDTTAYAPRFTKVTDAGSRADWTVIHTGSPTGTQAEFPAASVTDDVFDIETAAQSNTEASTFIARYMGVFFVQVEANDEDNPEPNVWTVSLTLTEALIGDYTFES